MESPTRRVRTEDPSERAARGQAPVLIAEDDNVTALLIKHSLEAAGFRVTRAQNGELVLREVEKQKPNVLVLDINMPRRGGLEVLRILRRNPSMEGVRILMLSGHRQAEVRAEALSQGANDYLTKPFVPQELVERVRKLDSSCEVDVTRKLDPAPPINTEHDTEQPLDTARQLGTAEALGTPH